MWKAGFKVIYAITEDMNSCRDFWKTVLVESGLKFKLVDLPTDKNGNYCGGNTTLLNQAVEAVSKMHKGDTLFVAFDNVELEGKFSSYDFLEAVQEMCAQQGIKFMYTPYYCFEELYLSYKGLVELYENQSTKDIDILETLQYVNKNLSTKDVRNRDYFNLEDKRIQRLVSIEPGAGKNREHFANVLLSTVTAKIKGHFRINKRKNGLGECWLDSCSDIVGRGSNVSYNCNTCKYCCKGRNTKEKLLDLRHRSLLALSDK